MSAVDNTYLDSLYETYKKAPDELESSWRGFFEGFDYALADEAAGMDPEQLNREFSVFSLIQSYRARGHLISLTNPVRSRIDRRAKLSLESFALGKEDLEKPFAISKVLGLKNAKLKEILIHLEKIYCGHLGIEFMHIADTDARRWVRDYMEKNAANFEYPREKKKTILKKLNEAVVFESFLQSKYVGQKRFSLEGGESTIPGLNAIIETGAELGVQEFVFGMAHRGRLNVLANIIGKTYEFIFDEFEGGRAVDSSENDVKYHLGYTTEKQTSSGKNVYLKIMHNPSHLEAVGVTANGFVRAQADVVYGKDLGKIVPVVLHGDAALAGQGIAYEAAQMSKLEAYQVGGTIHFVINNQIGFTTDFVDARSSHYCTSVGRVVDSPIIHVNGDDPEAVVFACEMAVQFRQKFRQDIYVDMVCYRKYGHNEGDEPMFTQPHLYGIVHKHKNPRDLYIETLGRQDDEMAELAEEMQSKFRSQLSDRFNNVKQKTIPKRKQGPHKEWMNLSWSKREDFDRSYDTSVPKDSLALITKAISSVPESFRPLKKALKILEDREKRFQSGVIDWALAEMLAYGSLLLEGNRVRFSGQDVIRGTFSHRHAKVYDRSTNEPYCGLSNIKEGQAEIEIYNSLLSEYAVLGFEYGYSLGSPKSLNIWEAQFGDFANGAQIVIDQFISACEHKWRRMTGLVLLLPHGHEGQGPEHSSARPERFLQMAAQGNMVVCNATTPANFFHLLRRQLAWNFRKPLIVFTPKSLLRHPECVSELEEFTDGHFREVICEEVASPEKIKKLLFCSGKIYYELLQKKKRSSREDVHIVRLEQLYPMPQKQVKEILKRFPKAKRVWVQEEPKNMGARSFLHRFKIFNKFEFVSRISNASPATGFASVHIKEQEKIIDEAFE